MYRQVYKAESSVTEEGHIQISGQMYLCVEYKTMISHIGRFRCISGFEVSDIILAL